MIWKDLLCCLSPRPPPSPTLLPINSEVKIDPDRVFCHVTSGRFDIVTETRDFIVFRDRSPAALHHLLAIPQTHTPNIKSIKGIEGASLGEDLVLKAINTLYTHGTYLAVRDLQRVGQNGIDAIIKKGEETNEIRFGFHIPPFRSVDHLHLHCLVLPFQSTIKAAKYRVASGDPQAHPPTSKGWGWFVTASQAIEILERNGDIKVGSC